MVFLLIILKNACFSQGWAKCNSCDMNTLFNTLPMEEQKRVKCLELFDEYEAWHTKCAHYIILCAFNGLCISLAHKLIPSAVKCMSGHPVYGEMKIETMKMTEKSVPLKR